MISGEEFVFDGLQFLSPPQEYFGQEWWPGEGVGDAVGWSIHAPKGGLGGCGFVLRIVGIVC